MKKIFAVLPLSILLLVGCTDANNYVITEPLYYDKAIVRLADGGVVEGRLNSFCQTRNGYVVVAVNGVKYCTSYTNVTLIRTENNE